MAVASNPILWTPSPAAVRDARLTHFQRRLASLPNRPSDGSYAALHRWSLDHRGAFWSAVWNAADVIGHPGEAVGNPEAAFVPGPRMTEAAWFPGATLNFAENLLRPADCGDDAFGHSDALLFESERGEQRSVSRRELLRQATAFARFLHGLGVRPGDRVAAVMPNTTEAVAAMLGTTAVGAVWSSCSPDFGVDAVRDRFGQIAPAVLVTAASAFYNGKPSDVIGKARAVLSGLPSVRACVLAGGKDIELPPGGPAWHRFDEIAARPPAAFAFERFPFAHPAFILYSSGTTGPPKCIVHGAGGTLLQHLKEHQLHTDVRPGDRLFYYTTTGWMMWNWLDERARLAGRGGPVRRVSGVSRRRRALGARRTQPSHALRRERQVFRQPRQARRRAARRPDLGPLRVVLSTGSPLLPESFDYVYRAVKADVCLSSITGGTDIVSCFALGCPTQPVRRGEIQVKGLGMDVRVVDEEGRAVVGEPGELVCASPFPSQPVGFWNDPDHANYRASYFGRFPDVWCHGDWAEETPAGGLVVHGRSDTTLNPGGVRIGTAEIYRQVEAFPEIHESLAAALRRNGDEQIVLFVRMRPGETLDDSLIAAIRLRLRSRCSPRHVPAFVLTAPDLPRTVSGKLSETAVRNSINGLPLKNAAALANPESLDFFRRGSRPAASRLTRRPGRSGRRPYNRVSARDGPAGVTLLLNPLGVPGHECRRLDRIRRRHRPAAMVAPPDATTLELEPGHPGLGDATTSPAGSTVRPVPHGTASNASARRSSTTPPEETPHLARGQPEAGRTARPARQRDLPRGQARPGHHRGRDPAAAASSATGCGAKRTCTSSPPRGRCPTAPSTSTSPTAAFR